MFLSEVIEQRARDIASDLDLWRNGLSAAEWKRMYTNEPVPYTDEYLPYPTISDEGNP